LLSSARVGRLALLDERDLPRVLPVTFAVWEGAVWSAIDRKPKRTAEPARVRRLRRRPEAALLVDRYDEDWSRLAWVMLEGVATILESGEERDAAAALLTEKYAQYKTLSLDGRPIVRVEIERGSEWSSGTPSS
jgi:PPOX class probable F420-dependent enzyme